jgi:hypothetical protein
MLGSKSALSLFHILTPVAVINLSVHFVLIFGGLSLEAPLVLYWCIF